MDDFFERFLAMVDVLRSHPEIVVTHFSLFDPIEQSEIESVEKVLEAELDASIKAFFLHTNGIQLKWIHKGNPDFEPTRYKSSDSSFDWFQPFEWYGVEDGCINILPLQLSLVKQGWGGIVWSHDDAGQQIEFAHQQYDLCTLLKAIKPLDVFSKSSSMAFVLRKESGNPKLLLTQDHFADIESSRFTDFLSYIEFLVHTWGVVNSRESYFSDYGGHEKEDINLGKEFWLDADSLDLNSLYK